MRLDVVAVAVGMRVVTGALMGVAMVVAMGVATSACATEHDVVQTPVLTVPTAIVDVPPPPPEPASGELPECPSGSHAVAELCVADGHEIPKWEPRGNGDPCASWNRPGRGLDNCDPANTGDPDMDHELGAILRALADAKLDLGKCKTARGPHGAGHIEMTYAPNGAATAAHVIGAPYEGTPTGACVAAKFRALKVPEFKKKPSITLVTAFAID